MFKLYLKALKTTRALSSGKFWIYLFLSVVSSVFELASMAMIFPIVIMMFNENVLSHSPILLSLYQLLGAHSIHNFITRLLLLIFLVFIIKHAIQILIVHRQSKYSFYWGKKLSQKLLAAYLRMPYLKFIEEDSVRMWQTIIVSPSTFSQHIFLNFLTLNGEIAVFIFFILGLAIYNFQIFLIVLLTILPLSSLLYAFVKNKLRKLGEENHHLFNSSGKKLLNILYNYIDIKILNKEKFLSSVYLENLEKLNRNQIRLTLYNHLPYRVIELSVIAGFISLCSFSMYMFDSFSKTALVLAIYGTASFRLMPSLNRIFTSFMNIKNHEFIFDIIEKLEVTRKIPEVPSDILEKELQFREKIVLKDISFQFASSELVTLKNINLTIKKGEYIGIVGPSGSGKSTLLRVLLQVIYHQKGEFSVDETIINNAEGVRHWQNAIGYVSQDIFIMDGSVTENIVLGTAIEKTNQERLKDSIRLSGLESFVDNLPAGMDTNLGEFGNKISEGQKQRIGIARALYRNPQVLILDEVTSSLDHQTERHVLDSILNLHKLGTTIVLVTHKQSSTEHCDKIYELRNGELFIKP